MANSTSAHDLMMHRLQKRLAPDSTLAPDESAIPIALASVGREGHTQDAFKRIKGISKNLKEGDLSDFESMLGEQAVLLNQIFSQLCVDAMAAGNPDVQAKMLGIALKAQQGTRKTISTIRDLKNPKKTVFIKKQENTLIAGEQANGTAQMDSRAKGIAGSENPTMEALEVQHRATDGQG